MASCLFTTLHTSLKTRSDPSLHNGTIREKDDQDSC